MTGDYLSHFTMNLQKILPERQQGEIFLKIGRLFDPSNQHPLFQIFEFVTYLSSNNILTESQTDTFLKWVIDRKHMDLLNSFLQIKTPTVEALSIRILESGVRIENTKFLQLLIASGIKLDSVLEDAIKIDDPSFSPFSSIREQIRVRSLEVLADDFFIVLPVHTTSILLKF